MFRTEIEVDPSDHKIAHTSHVLTIGSCFSDRMGKKLVENKFDVMINPFGTVYNPLSIFKLLSYAIDGQYPDSSTYHTSQGLQSNFDFHSSFSQVDRQPLETAIQQTIDETTKYLSSCQWLIITFGTAYVYERIDNKETVANCHKIPSKLFIKKLLTQKHILADFDALNEKLIRLNSNIKIMVTVSPVRHVKDTLNNNAVSKSVLRITCDTLEKKHDHLSYFPSYEIMMDDLRDYRFYKSDMIHPNEVAEDYIWEKFVATYCSQETQALIHKWRKLSKAINHKPFNTQSANHQQFICETIEQLKEFNKTLNVQAEIAVLKQQLIDPNE